MTAKTLKIGRIEAELVLKDIKNIHLSVYPPHGRVRISAPERMSLATIRVFVIAKLAWIETQQTKIREQERETPRVFKDRESHYLWGERYLLKVIESNAPPSVEVKPKKLVLRVRPGTEIEKKKAIFDDWYRNQVREESAKIVETWQEAIGVTASQIIVRRMKTKWGSCNPQTATIRLNTELAKKPRECLTYIIVHELVHLLEPTHNQRFKDLMDHYLPNWRDLRDTLNRLPVRHEEWGY